MSYVSEQGIPRDTEIQRQIQRIGDNTQKYIGYLELTAKQRIAFYSRFRGAGGFQGVGGDKSQSTHADRARCCWSEGAYPSESATLGAGKRPCCG